jgi:DNA polymerase-3 subunit gamma/tau
MAKKKPAADEPTASATEYTVLARRYRPQQFADVIGQEPVTRALVNALESNRVAHAYLFAGARGVGKTSTARILAKALNCVKGPTATPCDNCDSCIAVATGEDIDVVEIDGASNRQIDDIRELRSNVQYRPSRSRYKIYIVDEVHMLTKEAFNALLKTLEEPPPHVKFIFATTDAHKVPVTILSRCQRFDFTGIGSGRIVEQLRQVAQSENVAAADDALELIARRAGGSMRDAQSLLDQLLAFSNDGAKLTVDAVQQLLGMAHDDRVADLAAAIIARDPKRGLELLAHAVDDGLQLGELLDQLIEYWRDLMIVQCAGTEGRNLSVPSRHRQALAEQARALPLDTILAGLDILAATKARLRTTSHARVLIEMAVVRMGRLHDLVSLSQLTNALAGGDQAPVSAPALRRLSAAAEPEKKNLVRAADPENGSGALSLTEQSLPRVWDKVLAQAGSFLASDLKCVESMSVVGSSTLVLRFPAGYNPLHGSGPVTKSSVRIAERIEEVLRKVTGQTWSVRVESAAAAVQAPAATADASQSRTRRQMTDALQVPLVKRAFDLLGAQFIRVDEGFAAAPPGEADPADTAEVRET